MQPIKPPLREKLEDKKFIPGPLELGDAGKLKFRIHHSPPAKEDRPLKLAVTPAGYDDMGSLLAKLGKGYRFTPISERDLRDPAALGKFDVVFMTCGNSNAQDLPLISSLRQYVENGGTLYASDLRFDALRGAFPEFMLKKNVLPGWAPQNVKARVLEPELRKTIGANISLHFDSMGWMPAACERKKVKTIVEGSFVNMNGQKLLAPLLVKFSCRRGTVIFTSFHNARQTSKLEDKLLKYLVFTAVTAKAESTAQRAMLAAGFEPKESKNLTIAAQPAKLDFSAKTQKPGNLQFAVGFDAPGARLKIQVIAPNGEKIEHEDKATFILEIPDAPPGEWRYFISAPTIPFPNYPFSLIVGEAAAGKNPMQ